MIFRKVAKQFVNKHIFFQQLKDLKDWVYEIVRVDGCRRTDDQNKYLRGAVYPAIYEGLKWAYTIDEIHSIMSYQFLSRVSRGGSPYILSTSRLTTAEFSKYVEQIKDFVAQYDVVIPTAEEYKEWLKSLSFILSNEKWDESQKSEQ